MGALILIAAVLALADDDDALSVAPAAGVCNPSYGIRIDNCTHVLKLAGTTTADFNARVRAWATARGGIGTTAQEKEATLLAYLWEACPQCRGRIPEALFAGGAWRTWAELRSELEAQDP